jgi:hypothetical protein
MFREGADNNGKCIFVRRIPNEQKDSCGAFRRQLLVSKEKERLKKLHNEDQLVFRHCSADATYAGDIKHHGNNSRK